MQEHVNAALCPPNRLELISMSCREEMVFCHASNSDRSPPALNLHVGSPVTTLSLVPAAADKLAEVLGEKEAKLMRKKKKKGDGSMRASDQLTADDFITPYIDDEDTDEED